MNDVLAAEDANAASAHCNGGLNIGGGRNVAAGAIRTGLIDDVRIHNGVIKPEDTLRTSQT